MLIAAGWAQCSELPPPTSTVPSGVTLPVVGVIPGRPGNGATFQFRPSADDHSAGVSLTPPTIVKPSASARTAPRLVVGPMSGRAIGAQARFERDAAGPSVEPGVPDSDGPGVGEGWQAATRRSASSAGRWRFSTFPGTCLEPVP